jgi:uncharacterized OB-fold protein
VSAESTVAGREALHSVPPQPLPDPDSQGYWDALAEGRIALCRCTECGTWMHPPLERCRRCGGPTQFDTVAGSGRIFSLIVMHRASVPGQGDGPYAIGTIDLDGVEGARLTGRIVGPEPADIHVGDRVAGRIVPVPGGRYHDVQFDVV